MKTAWLLAGVAVLALAGGCKKKPMEAPAEAPQTGGPLVDNTAPAAPTTTPVDGEATLQLAPTSVAGVNVPVAWTGPANGGDYIDLVPRGETKTEGEVSYVYVPKDRKSPLDLRAPTTAGEYDVRYVAELPGGRKVKATAPLTVTAATATLSVPATAGQGEAMSIAWTGPNAGGDYLDVMPAGETKTDGEITYAYTSAGSPAKMSAPGKPGDYQVRYVAEGPGGRKVLTSSPLTVQASPATLAAPDTAARGAKIKVEWTGPRRSGDYVDLVKKGSITFSGEASYFYVTATVSELTAANQAGDYEIRYVLEAPGGRQALARRSIAIR